jgi:putative transposase
MPIARRHLIDDDSPGCYHLVSRCVRRAHLCGAGQDHRRDWIAEAVERASRCFAMETLGFAVMDNHFHLILSTDPARALSWDDLTVAQHWAALHPQQRSDGDPEPWKPEEIAALAANTVRIHTLRKRLASISWCMKWIKEGVARRANREDKVTGHFWEGRFHSTRLLDQAALIACLVYVDLNPIRAAIVDRPEHSRYTSVRERIRQRQHWRQTALLQQQDPNAITPQLRRILELGPESELWIAPLQRCDVTIHEPQIPTPTLSLDEYLDLVDTTGRLIRSDKRGFIPKHLQPILERLDIDAEHWVDLMRANQRFLGAAIGSAWARATEATRRGVKWIRRTLSLYRDDPAPDLSAAPG